MTASEMPTQEVMEELRSFLHNFGDDPELLKEVIQMFFDDAPVHVEKIEQAAQDSDADTLMKQAHGLKGMTGNFSQGPAFEAARKLEMLGRNGSVSGYETHLASLKIEMDKLYEALKYLMK